MVINFFVNFIKTISITICIGFSIIKISNYGNITKKKVYFIILLNAVIASIYALTYDIFLDYEISSITNLLCYLLYSFIFAYIIRIPFTKGLILSLVAITATFISKFLAGAINFLPPIISYDG